MSDKHDWPGTYELQRREDRRDGITIAVGLCIGLLLAAGALWLAG